ncbi:pyridoxamine 5'-phosphate oxidase family protein [Kitasatospora sp. NPDC088346]|uniref:pyridoxamine 5'-phosphate oxidase family protein n=1 Tax=Kitasatospora sp. NPDC088346 TaxID=3364073 RepID=UPI0038041E44
MDRSEVAAQLADPVAQRLLASCRLTRLAYTGRDGAPRVVPIGYTWTGTHFVLCTVPGSAKVAALTADPRVALTVDTDVFPPNVLLVRGTAALETVEGVPEEFLDASRRYLDPEAFPAWEAEVRRLYESMTRITVTPSWAKVLDFETRIPSAVQELADRRQR